MRHLSPRLLALAARAVEAQARVDELPPDGETPYRRFRSILGPEQLGVVDDEAAKTAVCGGRRCGKTTTFIGASLKAFEERPRAGVVYFAPSDEQGVNIIWEEIREHNATYDLGLKERWSEKWWIRGGRKIEVIGFNKRADVERARGRKFDLLWIDEAQLGPDWFAKKMEAAAFPTIIDYRGRIVLSGTPSEVADGLFFDAFHATDGSWSNRHTWNASRNPFFLRQGRDALAEARQRLNLTEQSIIYRREWLAEWIVDPDALVYFIPDAAVRVSPAPTYFAHVLGLDLGWKDHDAIAAVGVEPLRQWSHLRHVETKGQQTNHQLFRRLMDLAPHFPGANGAAPTVVYDPAGHATRKTIETFRADAPKLNWVQAEKARKVEFIQLLNDDLRSGQTFVEPNSLMLKEAKRLRWKRPGKLAEDADHSDPGDAWLYSWRHARDMLRELPKKEPKKELDPFDEHMQRVAEDEQQGYFSRRKRQIAG